MVSVTSTKAEILGLLCAEGNYRGYVDIYFNKDYRRRKIYLRERWKEIIEFSNTHVFLLEHFQHLLEKEYNYRPNITKSNNNVFRVCITKVSVIRDILNYTNLGCLNWRIPEEVINSENDIKAAFTRGFFDGDGSVDFTKHGSLRVRFSSSNYAGLISLSTLLNSINLHHNLNGPYLSSKKLPIYEILLSTKSIPDFVDLVGSMHKAKNARLQTFIAEGNAEVDSFLSSIA